MIIRLANKTDLKGISDLFTAYDMPPPKLTKEELWCGLDAGRVVAAAHVGIFDGYYVMSSVTVEKEMRRMGLGRRLVKEILFHRSEDLYIYTAVPPFFKKLGFQTTDPISETAVRELYGCRECSDIDSCICMVARKKSEG